MTTVGQVDESCFTNPLHFFYSIDGQKICILVQCHRFAFGGRYKKYCYDAVLHAHVDILLLPIIIFFAPFLQRVHAALKMQTPRSAVPGRVRPPTPRLGVGPGTQVRPGTQLRPGDLLHLEVCP